MRVIYGEYEKVYTEAGNAVAIGNFDGLHKGHMKVIDSLLSNAKNKNLSSCVYTFKDHPINYFKGKGTLPLIADNNQKAQRLSEKGVDTLFFEDFSKVYNIPAEDFVRDVLVSKFNMKACIVGRDNRFGKNSEGDVSLLSRLSEKYSYSVCIVEPYYFENTLCSSTRVREFIKVGDMPRTANILGYNFKIAGIVEDGKHLGHKLGFPTANIIPPADSILPACGVYATNTFVGDKVYKSITNVGTAPTVDDKVLRLETYIIDFNDNIYGEYIEIEFLLKMRSVCAFNSVEELKSQLKSDTEERQKMIF